MKEKKVGYITGALTGIKKNGDVYEATFHDKSGTYFFKKALGMNVGSGYKLGIIDTDKPNRYEIVSVEQPLLADPAFTIKGPQGKVVQMKEQDYRDIIQAKKIKIRTETIKSAIEICKHTLNLPKRPDLFEKEVLKLSKDLEQYFE